MPGLDDSKDVKVSTCIRSLTVADLLPKDCALRWPMTTADGECLTTWIAVSDRAAVQPDRWIDSYGIQ